MARRLYRNHILGELTACQRHIAQSRTHIAQQEQIVAWREIHGTEVALSRNLLRTFMSLLESHERHRDVLLRELGDRGSP